MDLTLVRDLTLGPELDTWIGTHSLIFRVNIHPENELTKSLDDINAALKQGRPVFQTKTMRKLKVLKVTVKSCQIVDKNKSSSL